MMPFSILPTTDKISCKEKGSSLTIQADVLFTCYLYMYVDKIFAGALFGHSTSFSRIK